MRDLAFVMLLAICRPWWGGDAPTAMSLAIETVARSSLAVVAAGASVHLVVGVPR
jgi:hypothetical protein